MRKKQKRRTKKEMQVLATALAEYGVSYQTFANWQSGRTETPKWAKEILKKFLACEKSANDIV